MSEGIIPSFGVTTHTLVMRRKLKYHHALKRPSSYRVMSGCQSEGAFWKVNISSLGRQKKIEENEWLGCFF
jgi:hypothetical protein